MLQHTSGIADYIRAPAFIEAFSADPGAYLSPPGPGKNSAGIGIFRYRGRCGTVYGHTGSFPGYRLLLAANAGGGRSVVFSVNAQIVPGQGSQRVAAGVGQGLSRTLTAPSRFC